jgi:hypothetical protein
MGGHTRGEIEQHPEPHLEKVCPVVSEEKGREGEQEPDENAVGPSLLVIGRTDGRERRTREKIRSPGRVRAISPMTSLSVRWSISRL